MDERQIVKGLPAIARLIGAFESARLSEPDLPMRAAILHNNPSEKRTARA